MNKIILAMVLFAGTIGDVNVSSGQVIIDDPVAIMPGAGNSDLALFVLPDGTGSPFSEAQIKQDGTLVDARITLTLLDSGGSAVPDYPREDIWLESGDLGLIPCVGGTSPDSDTDHLGVTSWENPMRAGGNSEDLLYVIINGDALTTHPFSLAINSADMNGNGVVDLADVGQFSEAFFGDYSFSADFFADGVLNLNDVSRLAGGLGTTCP